MDASSAKQVPSPAFETAFRRWADDHGVQWETFALPLENGRCETTAHRLVPPLAPRRVVLTLHGAGNDAFFGWIGLFKELLRRGAEILTFDLPGHGRLCSTAFSLETSLEAVAAAVDECRRRHEPLPIHGVGVSLGGSVLLHSLGRGDLDLASATLIVAPLEIVLSARSLLREVGRESFRTLLREREHYGLTGLIPSFGPFKRDIYPLRLATSPPAGAFGYVESLNAELRQMRLEEAAERMKEPVLLVYGERDSVVPIAQGERLKAAFPDAELFRVPRGTHLSTPLEPATTERILSWLEEHG
jgi:alpha-beta hydrolase superfamily lysophospholipase